MGYSINTPFGTLRQGSWGILPELGLTERAAQRVSGGQTRDLSDAFLGSSNAQTPPQDGGPTRTDLYSTSRSNTPQQQFSNQLPSQPKQQQQQAQQSSGNFMDYYGGWNQNQAYQDFTQVFGGNIDALRRSRGVFSGDELAQQQANLNRELEGVYNPAFESLNQQEDFLRNRELPSALAAVAENTKYLKGELQAQQGDANKQFYSQQSALETSKESALQAAVRLRNAMQQSVSAKYGRGSSTGPAMSELVDQESARSQGQILNSYQQQVGSLVDHQAKVVDFTVREAARIDRESKLKEEEANTEFSRRLLQISTDRNALSSAKAAARLDLLRQAQANVQALKNARESALIQLDSWKQQQEFLISKGLAGIQQQYQDIQFSPLSQSNNRILQGPQQTTQPQTTARPVNYLGKVNDDYEGLINPFA